jgi:uncharacterized membrane protein
MRNIIQWYKQQDDIIKALLAGIASGIFLLFVRIIISREITYLFLVWNLFLACVPFFISSFIKTRSEYHTLKTRSFVAVFVWLVFFPNAPYILTDFFHLYERSHVPLWLDLLVISFFAWNGLLIGFLSLKDMQQIISKKWGIKTGWLFALSVLILGSFGVYIGRYLRYNSWDIILNPFFLMNDMAQIIFQPHKNKAAFGMTIGMSVFLSTTYYTFKMMLHSPRRAAL